MMFAGARMCERLPLRNRLRSLTRTLKQELQVYRLVLADKRTPRLARWLLAGAIAYLLAPVDLIPDFLPGIGHLDDALVVPGLVYLALRMVPPQVVAEAREKVKGGPTA
jgi:uncharacterized membrane protein YkvA (DUF1232 family)